MKNAGPGEDYIAASSAFSYTLSIGILLASAALSALFLA